VGRLFTSLMGRAQKAQPSGFNDKNAQNEK